METKVSWKGKLAFQGQTEAGHQILMDVKPDAGGEGKRTEPHGAGFGCVSRVYCHGYSRHHEEEKGGSA